jgi:hypothetical protein
MKHGDVVNAAGNRRAFLKGVSLTGIGLASAAVIGSKLGGVHEDKVEAASYSDVDILNFALNLEYLEAEFYTVATTGKTLEESGFAIDGVGHTGPTTGGKLVNFFKDSEGNMEKSGVLNKFVYQIANDEQQHVKLLRAALGDLAVAKPALNLDALGIGFNGFMDFLALARAFEDTGVSAYGGAAPAITSAAYLGTAVQIGLTEAYHASLLRQSVAINNVKTSPLDALDVIPPPSGFNYINANYQGLAVVRSTSRVLAIVLGSHHAGTTSGGFFPNGVNGSINMV